MRAVGWVLLATATGSVLALTLLLAAARTGTRTDRNQP